MYDLFVQLGIAFFVIEILHRAYDMYMIISLRLEARRHDRYCEDCADDILAETFKSMRDRDE